jgi:hypothetical protein
MIFFLCFCLFGSGLSPFTEKARATGAARGSSLQRAPRNVPPVERASEGDRAATDAEGSNAEKDLKTASQFYQLAPRERAQRAWLITFA